MKKDRELSHKEKEEFKRKKILTLVFPFMKSIILKRYDNERQNLKATYKLERENLERMYEPSIFDDMNQSAILERKIHEKTRLLHELEKQKQELSQIPLEEKVIPFEMPRRK